MSKYSLVKAKNLQSQINNTMIEMEKYKFDTISSNLTNVTVLDSPVTIPLQNTFNKITSGQVNGSLATIKKELNTLNSACTLIIEIQKLEAEVKKLQQEVSSLEKRKWKTETYTDDEGNTKTRKVLNQGIVRQINAKNNLIKQKNGQRDELERKVDTLLN